MQPYFPVIRRHCEPGYGVAIVNDGVAGLHRLASGAPRRARTRRRRFELAHAGDADEAAAGNISQAHIPGARFFDIDELSDRSNPSPHMLPAPPSSAMRWRVLGIGSNERIIVYDNSPLRTATRGWFTLRHFGAREVAVLDGGFQKWLAERRPTESGEPSPRGAQFDASEKGRSRQQAADSRRPGVRACRRARQVAVRSDRARAAAWNRWRAYPWRAQSALRPALSRKTGLLKSREDLRRLFANAGIDPAKPFIASCGSGVTATSLIFAAHLLGNDSGAALRRKLD